MNKKLNGFRMPAEWELQKSVWIAWPYNKNDWPGLFQGIPEVFTKIISSISKDQKVNLLVNNDKNEIIKFLKLANSNLKNIRFYKIKNLNDIYQTKNQLVSFSQKMQKFDKKIKRFLKHKMYFHKNVKSKTNYGRKVITKLFLQIKKNPKKYINIKKYSNSNIDRIISDYIAGMTDRYAINLYNKL